MTIEMIQSLRQTLLDNAAGHPLAQVHRNNLFALLDECEAQVKAAKEEVPAGHARRKKPTA